MKHGDLYWAEFPSHLGSTQKKRRPVLILSHDGFNQTTGWRSIIIAPIATSLSHVKKGPTAIFLSEKSSGLKKDSVVLCHQITTLHRNQLKDRIGILPKEQLRHVEKGLKIAMNLI